MTLIYLLHFSKSYQHARHYLGFCEQDDPAERVAAHLAGRESPLVKAAIGAGIEVTLAHVITDADRTFERRLKNRGSFCRWCPQCGLSVRPLPVFVADAPLTARMKRSGRGGINRSAKP